MFRQAAGQQLGQVGAADPGELAELGAAGEPVGQHDGVPGRADGGQQGGFGHGRRHVVVAALDTEVAGQAAAAAHRGDLGTGPGQQRGVGVPAHHGVVVAVRLGHRAHAAEIGWLPVAGPVSSSASVRVAALAREARGSSGSSSVISPRSTAVHEGSRPTTGTPSLSAGPRALRLRRSCRRAPSSWPVEIQVRPQHIGSAVICTAYPAASSTRTAARPTSGVK